MHICEIYMTTISAQHAFATEFTSDVAISLDVHGYLLTVYYFLLRTVIIMRYAHTINSK